MDELGRRRHDVEVRIAGDVVARHALEQPLLRAAEFQPRGEKPQLLVAVDEDAPIPAFRLLVGVRRPLELRADRREDAQAKQEGRDAARQLLAR